MAKVLTKTFLLLILTPLVLCGKDVLVVKAGNGGAGGKAVSIHGDAFGGNGGKGGSNHVTLKEYQSRCASFYGSPCSKAKLKVFIAGNGGKGGNAISKGGDAVAGDGGDGGSNFIKDMKSGRPSKEQIIAKAGKGGRGGNAVGFFNAIGGDGGRGGDNNISEYVFNQWHYKNWNRQSRWGKKNRPCRCCSNAGKKVWVSAGNGGAGGSAWAFLGDAVGGKGGKGGSNYIKSAVYSTCCCQQSWGFGCGWKGKRVKKNRKYGYGCGCQFNRSHFRGYKSRKW